MRDDLELWDYALSLGYKVDFHEKDKRAKRISKENIPMHGLTFKKEGLWIWQCGQSYPEIKLWWQARNHINGHLEPYETRREYNTLKEALDNEM
jgi:hypothetical protein